MRNFPSLLVLLRLSCSFHRADSNCNSTCCNASLAPLNGGVGNCTGTLADSSECQPTCDRGYSVSGVSTCRFGTLTAAVCVAKPCNVSWNSIFNGTMGIGNCNTTSPMMASGSSCQPVCTEPGYTMSGPSTCFTGTFTSTTCHPDSCDASAAPDNGAVGNCTSSLASGRMCQPTCRAGYTAGRSFCFAGKLTRGVCAPNPCRVLPPQNGEFGGCSTSLLSGTTCRPICHPGYSITTLASCQSGHFSPAKCTWNFQTSRWKISSTVKLVGMYPAAFSTSNDAGRNARESFIAVISEGVGAICKANGQSQCTKEDIRISSVTRRSLTQRATALAFVVKFATYAAADTGARVLRRFLDRATKDGFKNKLLAAKGGMFANLTSVATVHVSVSRTPSPPASADDGTSGLSTMTIVMIAALAGFIPLLMCCACCWVACKRREDDESPLVEAELKGVAVVGGGKSGQQQLRQIHVRRKSLGAPPKPPVPGALLLK